MHEKTITSIRDYKIYCFNGKPEFLYLSEGLENHSTARISYVNLDWTPAKFKRNDYREFEPLPQKPKHLDEMIELAETLSQGINFVRVDFYEIKNRVYFGELTFFPGSGFTPFASENDDMDMGRLLDISK